MQQPSAFDNLRYGLLSPVFRNRLEAVRRVAEGLPAVLVERNHFVNSLKKGVADEKLVDTAAVFLRQSPHLLAQVEVLAGYFNALALVLEKESEVKVAEKETEDKVVYQDRLNLESLLKETQRQNFELEKRLIAKDEEIKKLKDSAEQDDQNLNALMENIVKSFEENESLMVQRGELEKELQEVKEKNAILEANTKKLQRCLRTSEDDRKAFHEIANKRGHELTALRDKVADLQLKVHNFELLEDQLVTVSPMRLMDALEQNVDSHFSSNTIPNYIV
ncbi:hypothetical protein QR680_008038 [Steinernema hermaphroditum]|uniref:Uncharacterized protein n=1 Tax=Steinernema hermaphroditum TaxID=289476 RepID=A0AA39M7D1_9BILA|nr:hypothetical protein QR680_008038 [Steinernema hermaphroditum]